MDVPDKIVHDVDSVSSPEKTAQEYAGNDSSSTKIISSNVDTDEFSRGGALFEVICSISCPVEIPKRESTIPSNSKMIHLLCMTTVKR